MSGNDVKRKIVKKRKREKYVESETEDDVSGRSIRRYERSRRPRESPDRDFYNYNMYDDGYNSGWYDPYRGYNYGSSSRGYDYYDDYQPSFYDDYGTGGSCRACNQRGRGRMMYDNYDPYIYRYEENRPRRQKERSRRPRRTEQRETEEDEEGAVSVYAMPDVSGSGFKDKGKRKRGEEYESDSEEDSRRERRRRGRKEPKDTMDMYDTEKGTVNVYAMPDVSGHSGFKDKSKRKRDEEYESDSEEDSRMERRSRGRKEPKETTYDTEKGTVNVYAMPDISGNDGFKDKSKRKRVEAYESDSEEDMRKERRRRKRTEPKDTKYDTGKGAVNVYAVPGVSGNAGFKDKIWKLRKKRAEKYKSDAEQDSRKEGRKRETRRGRLDDDNC